MLNHSTQITLEKKSSGVLTSLHHARVVNLLQYKHNCLVHCFIFIPIFKTKSALSKLQIKAYITKACLWLMLYILHLQI